MVEHAQAAIGPALPQGRQRMVTKPGTPLASHPRHNEFAQEGDLLMSAPAEPRPSRPIRFVHRGAVQEVSGLPPTTTVLQWLREHAHCTGTKEGCAEGDCGACTVVVGELNDAGQLVKKTVNSLHSVFAHLGRQGPVHGRRRGPRRATAPLPTSHGGLPWLPMWFLHPRLCDELWHIYESHEQSPTRSELADALSGNLCRCTGYRPILDAGQQMFEAPRVPPQDQATIEALAHLQHKNTQPLVYVGPSVVHGGHAQRFVAPTTLADLAAWRLAWPQARLVAGSTDVGLWVTKQFKDLGDVIYLGQVQALRQIEQTDTQPDHRRRRQLEAAWQALTQAVPHLREVWLRFASPPVRHAGTLGGNVANGSPIGDGAPILLALNASLVLRKGSQTRELPLSAFYLDYMKNALTEGEWIQSISRAIATCATQGEVMRAYKVSKRRDSDISALCAGLYLRLQGDTITEARLAWGGMAATAKRASQAEAALLGQPWTEATLRPPKPPCAKTSPP
jgi:xanthine dehydrogenase small subunit